MLRTLENLCAPIAVSGDEGALCSIIKNEVEPFCDKVYTDLAGNLICQKRGKTAAKSKIMIAAHMDEVGFVITSVTDDGLLKFASVGGIDERIFLGKKVCICGKKEVVRGVIGTVPPHLLSKEKSSAVLKEDELYINIGAESKEDALLKVSLGDCGTLTGDFVNLGGGKIMSRALDDRCGCAVLIELIKSELACDITAVFTVQEEIGLRGAQIAASAIKPDIAIVIDSTTACDVNDIPDEKTVCNLNKGGVVSFMDRGCAYDRELFNLILKTAEDNNIPAQVKRAVAGANDSASIHKIAGGVRTAAISLPCRYIHSPNSVVASEDLNSVYALVLALLPEIKEL